MIDKKQNERILENFERIAHTIKMLKDLLLCSKVGTDALILLTDEVEALYKEYENIKGEI